MTDGPRLLVSVRNESEADAALEGGAHWIDLKEPLRGPLGAVAAPIAAQVVEQMRGRVPVSAACGELIDSADAMVGELSRLTGLLLLKFGTAGCADIPDWIERLAWAIGLTQSNGKLFALGAYADCTQAASPPPEEVLAAASHAGADWILLDTFNKSGPGLLELLSVQDIESLAQQAAERRLGMAVAGRLKLSDLRLLRGIGPVVFGVRGVVCVGSRTDCVSRGRVAEAVAELSGIAASTEGAHLLESPP